MAVTTAGQARTRATRSGSPATKSTQSTAGLLATLASLPEGHPRRAAVRDRVIEGFLPLANHLARRFRDRGEPFDDLLQTATVGLIKAVDRFDPAVGTEFVSFAVPTIIGEIRRHFRDRTWAVRVPRRLQELRLAINDANAELTHTLGCPPTVAQIAAHLDVTEEAVLEGLEGARAYKATSLSSPIGGDDGTGATLGDMLGTDDPGYAAVEARAALATALTALPERERQILLMRFHGNMTQKNIAERIGISQMHVSRLITRSLAVLRDRIGAVT